MSDACKFYRVAIRWLSDLLIISLRIYLHCEELIVSILSSGTDLVAAAIKIPNTDF
jgi:hypothetical protein